VCGETRSKSRSCVTVVLFDLSPLDKERPEAKKKKGHEPEIGDFREDSATLNELWVLEGKQSDSFGEGKKKKTEKVSKW
jgi:hypothetical protein